MMINGKWVENTTCPRCNYRHPAVISCAQAALSCMQAALSPEPEGPRFVLSAGRHFRDTWTQDQFSLRGGGPCTQTGALYYDPARLDELARDMLEWLNSRSKLT